MPSVLLGLFLLILSPGLLAQTAGYPAYPPYYAPPPTPVQNTRPEDKKTRFTEWLLPYILQENQRLMETRQSLWRLISYLDAGYRLEPDTALWLERLAQEYKLDSNPVSDPEARIELLKRVDVIPPSLALAQAAIESAWGQSRFTRIANNLFGIWTFDKNRGVLPKSRESGKKHYVRRFADAGESLRFYMHLLNTQPAYRRLRELRHQQRLRGEALSGPLLAEGLERYSARGKDYVTLIRNMIRQNGWSQWDYF
jgi:Bax protein